jgi:hypothetical protein
MTEAEGLTWYPRVRIDKYSADQVRWARRRLEGWPLAGSTLLRLMQPEDGTVCDEGNGVTGFGVDNMARVLAGEGGHPLAPGRACFGVGTDATPFHTEHVRLAPSGHEQPDQTWYVPMDLDFPTVGGFAELHGQATFTETAACFDWHEWCWATGPGRPQEHHSIAQVYAGQAVMLNRKASQAGYGVKEPGVAWVFRTQVKLLG